MEDQSIHEDQAQVKKRAMQRMIVAASLVAAAVIALTFLNHKKAEIPVTTHTETRSEDQPTIPPIQSLETPPPESPEIKNDIPPPPAEKMETEPAPPPPEVVNKPLETSPVQASPSSRTHQTSLATRREIKEADTPEPMPQPIKITPTEPAPIKSAPPPAKAATSPPPVTPTKPAPEPQAFTVQVGLFTNYENAVQLQKRLAENGIKSYTETRLHVGPFKNKAEAEATQAKLRELGLSPVVAPAR
ncbi:MAG: SPOR domain-containing protein [Sulfuricellaceae bacterium]|nr:SPOR domain-containing protein [Sulfuricellaceae bacterium]